MQLLAHARSHTALAVLATALLFPGLSYLAAADRPVAVPAAAPVVPLIEGKTAHEPHTLVRMHAAAVEPDNGLEWKVRPLDQALEGKVQFTLAGVNEPDLEFTAPPGRYRVELTVVKADGKKLTIRSAELVITIGPAPPAPKPLPTPVPTPKPKPPEPKPEPAPAPKPKPPEPEPAPKPKPPVVPDADAALVALFAPLIDAPDKAHAVALGKVYATTGALLESLNDPAVKPRTFADVLAILNQASVASGVPRLPALLKLRTAVAKEAGDYAAMAPMTAQLTAELAAKYKKIGAAVQAAASK